MKYYIMLVVLLYLVVGMEAIMKKHTKKKGTNVWNIKASISAPIRAKKEVPY
jgi:hypothetical protein